MTGKYGLDMLKNEMKENLEGAMLYSIEKGEMYDSFGDYEEDMQSFRFSDVFGKGSNKDG